MVELAFILLVLSPPNFILIVWCIVCVVYLYYYGLCAWFVACVVCVVWMVGIIYDVCVIYIVWVMKIIRIESEVGNSVSMYGREVVKII